jgi:hypothetical protein
MTSIGNFVKIQYMNFSKVAMKRQTDRQTHNTVIPEA